MSEQKRGLVWLTPRVAYLPGAVNTGLLAGGEGRSVAVDTGIDGEAARKLRRAAEDAGYRIAAIINTHSHADHCGGNRWLQDRTGAPVFCSPLERSTIEHPILEPSFLFSGAAPPPALRNRFLMAQGSRVEAGWVEGLGGQALQSLAGVQAEILELPGHALGQLGVACDGVLFCGDAFFDPEVVDKHRVPFFADPARGVATLQRLTALSLRLVPGHGHPVAPDEAGREVLDYNRSTLLRLRREVLDLLGEPRTEESLVAALAARTGLEFANEGLYYLVKTSLQGYLSWLADDGLAQSQVEGAKVTWRAVAGR